MSPTESALRLSLAAPQLRAELEVVHRVILETLTDSALAVDLRVKLALRAEAIERILETSPCGHPLAYARYDGLWPSDVCPIPTVIMTCTAPGCGSSMSVPTRSDVADRIRRAKAATDAIIQHALSPDGGDLARGGGGIRVIPFPARTTVPAGEH